jgi:hypothetical protein
MTQHEKPYTVIVGVSATSKSPTALVWGRAQAQANQGRLIAVRVYQAPNVLQRLPSTSSETSPSADEVRTEQRIRLERDVAEVLGENHGAELRVVRGSKHRELLDQAREADLLVIDAPRTPMSPLLAWRTLHAATCPVVVMPPSISGVPESAWSRSAHAVGRAALRSAGTSGRPGYRPPPTPTD